VTGLSTMLTDTFTCVNKYNTSIIMTRHPKPPINPPSGGSLVYRGLGLNTWEVNQHRLAKCVTAVSQNRSAKSIDAD